MGPRVSTKPAQPAPDPTLSEFAYGRISKALISGRLSPGERLTLRGLSKSLNISSTPIRDAIRQLSAENAIDFAPNRYIRVPVLTGDQLRELRDIRLALEGMAVECGARNADADAGARLRALDGKIRHFRDAGNVAETVASIQEIHFEIYGLSRRAHLIRLIESLWLRTAPYVSLLFPEYSGRERGNLRGMIIEAIAAGDAASARRFLEADVCGAMNYIIGRVEAGAFGPHSSEHRTRTDRRKGKET